MNRTFRDLIIVTGHAIYTGNSSHSPLDETHWILAPFQKGEAKEYVKHIKKGIELALNNAQSLLLFSGGMTNEKTGQLSEAQSYWNLARKIEPKTSNIQQRVYLEEYARNSLENLLFSITKFREVTGRTPDTIHLISWGFKQERFQLHCKTIGYPLKQFHFCGIGTPNQIEDALIGEEKTLAAFKKDPWGQHSPLLDKTLQRDPFHRHHPYKL